MNLLEIIIIIISLIIALFFFDKVTTFIVMILTYSIRDVIDYIKYLIGKKKYKTYKSFWRKVANDYARQNYIGNKDPYEALMEKLNSNDNSI